MKLKRELKLKLERLDVQLAMAVYIGNSALAEKLNKYKKDCITSSKKWKKKKAYALNHPFRG